MLQMLEQDVVLSLAPRNRDILADISKFEVY